MKNSKQVRETSAGRSISAWVILKKGKYIATVQAHYGNSLVTVDVWDNSGRIYAGKAGGYGYDKFTSALSGAVIDGHKIYDHCGQDGKSQKLLKSYHGGKSYEACLKLANKIGCHFANWRTEKQNYMSLHYISGLDRLRTLGYEVIQAI